MFLVKTKTNYSQKITYLFDFDDSSNMVMYFVLDKVY